MLDAEASRQTAHIFLDAAAVHHLDDATDFATRDDMTELALRRLREVGSILLTQDDETGRVSLDITRAQTGILAVIVACVEGWANCAGVDPDEIITEVRRIIDAELVAE